MDPKLIAKIFQGISTFMEVAPLTIQTVQGIKKLFANDPNTPAELAAIIKDTIDDDAAAHAAVMKFLADNPE